MYKFNICSKLVDSDTREIIPHTRQPIMIENTITNIIIEHAFLVILVFFIKAFIAGSIINAIINAIKKGI